MKLKKLAVFFTAIALLTACSANVQSTPKSVSKSVSQSGSAEDEVYEGLKSVEELTKSPNSINLYGEAHAQKDIIEKEFELWKSYYDNAGMRHLFVEYGYYTAEYLNLWLQSDNDDYLNKVFDSWQGTAAHSPYTTAFLKQIKEQCPETVFHGTDVGHQYDTLGLSYLKYLEEQGKTDTESYRLAQENIEQGKHFYAQSDDIFREEKMAENFKREYDKLENEKIMGIYGSAHTGLNSMDFTGKVPSMANSLQSEYGNKISSVDLSICAKNIEPISVKQFEIAGKSYEAAFFGEVKAQINNYTALAYYRLENAYESFKDAPYNGDYLPVKQYPALVEENQIYLIVATKKDGTADNMLYRFDKNKKENELVLSGIKAE